MIVCATDTVEGTRAVAAAVAALVVEGDLLVLVGDLGAGKTAFTQGFARRLGVDEPVTSPTFTLANRYSGSMTVNHLDAYRVEALSEAEDLAIPELLEDGVTLVEWGDNILPALPTSHLEIRITLGEGDDDRVLQFTAAGSVWQSRSRALAELLDTWVVR
jgi:tRNA threonylcarbamoyladenosine biosynthesis protein TsaE